MKKGKKIRVYQDPITKQHFEGWAQLVRPQNNTEGALEFWTVRFAGDFGRCVQRWVDPADIEPEAKAS